jgi:hypothetical protein
LKVSPEPVTRPVGRDRLKALYEPKGVTPDKEVIAYRRIGERSSHSWFVLKYLLGFPNVKNYDGSWTEWGISCVRRSRSRRAPRCCALRSVEAISAGPAVS